MTVKGSPERTCVVCRRSGPKGELLRVVVGADGLVVDAKNQLPGRGAYVHRNTGCGEQKGVVERLCYSIAKRAGGGEIGGGLKMTSEYRQRFEAELRASLGVSCGERPKPSRARLGKIAGAR